MNTARRSLLLAPLLATLLPAACGHDEGEGEEEGADKVWNADPDFGMTPSLDTGNLIDRCHAAAPWGRRSWGVEAGSFDGSDAQRRISGARFVTTADNAYLYAKDEAGRWSFARYIQGDVWGGTGCGGAAPWNVPEPLEVSLWGKQGRAGRLVLELDLYRDQVNRWAAESWAMLAVNVWVSSPDFPAKAAANGGDKTGRKPLVLDLALVHECGPGSCVLRDFEDEAAFHYQRHAGADCRPSVTARRWSRCTIDFSRHLTQALAADYASLMAPGQVQRLSELAADTIAIHQLEFVAEVRHAEAAATIGAFRLLYR